MAAQNLSMFGIAKDIADLLVVTDPSLRIYNTFMLADPDQWCTVGVMLTRTVFCESLVGMKRPYVANEWGRNQVGKPIIAGCARRPVKSFSLNCTTTRSTGENVNASSFVINSSLQRYSSMKIASVLHTTHFARCRTMLLKECVM